MRSMRTRVTFAVAVAVAAIAVPLTVISLASAGDDHSLTAVAKSATARFHDLGAAKAAGWSTLVKDQAGLICIDNQPVGGMGVHWANASILFDATLDPTQPEALVYAPNADGQPKLAALEYIVFADAWTKAGHAGAPELFGQPFVLTPEPNRFGLPAFWSLHVWLWHPNPAGMFQPWNPNVHC
jgi:hypothetical protein